MESLWLSEVSIEALAQEAIPILMHVHLEITAGTNILMLFDILLSSEFKTAQLELLIKKYL